jgi:hypothetical protein
VRSSRFRGDDDLALIVSLAIAVGMLIGAVAMSLHTNELTFRLSGHEGMSETIEKLRDAK